MKMDAQLRRLAVPEKSAPWRQAVTKTGTEWIDILVKGMNCADAVRQAGGVVESDLGNFATARISIHDVPV